MNYESIKSVIRTCYHIIAVYSGEFKETGYSFTEIYTLAIIGYYPGIIASQIMEYIHLDRGYLSRVIKKLLQDDLIYIDDTTLNHRIKPLYLSDHGKEVFDSMEKKADESIERHIADASPDDKAEFFRLMKLLDENFKLVYPDTLRNDNGDSRIKR